MGQKMTTRAWTVNTWKLRAAAIALGVLLPAWAAAEQIDQPPGSAATTQSSKQSSKASQRAGKTPASEWTIQDALPDRSLAVRQYEPPSDPGIGRVPLGTGKGSFGFETEMHVKPNEDFNGRPVVPALQPNDNRARPFMGLSLSVPTGGK